MNDNYTHIDSRVMYVVENIPGPKEQSEEYEEIINCFNSQLTSNCQCGEFCTEEICKCIHVSCAANYVTCTQNEQCKYKLNKTKDFNKCSIIECNHTCNCSDDCGNRIVQKGPIPSLYVRTCENENKGLGLFTEDMILEGTFICEYAGEVITKSQALMRHQKNFIEGKSNYIFCLNEYSSGNVTQTFVDPSNFGNVGRYVNHSCEPNSYIVPVRIDTPIPKLAIFSISDILSHTEITIHYGFHNLGISVPEDKINRKKCLCNCKNCNGFMPFDVY